MKNVKFRIWNGHEMEYNVMAGFLGSFYVKGIDENDCSSLSPFNTKYNEETPLMQFTGVYSKDKKELYEGDLFKIGAEPMVFEVKFQQGCFVAFLDGEPFGLVGELEECFIDIIGNIYKNPELASAIASVNLTDKLNDFNQHGEAEAFETFARLHPVEAYDQNSHRFCEFARAEVNNPNLSDEEIKSRIDEIR